MRMSSLSALAVRNIKHLGHGHITDYQVGKEGLCKLDSLRSGGCSAHIVAFEAQHCCRAFDDILGIVDEKNFFHGVHTSL
jgi:hypothetical protein